MVGGDEARPPPQVAGLALELELLPDCSGIIGIQAGCSLKDDFCPLLGDAVGYNGMLLFVSSHGKS